MNLEYKGFVADVEYDEGSVTWIGRLENIKDYVNFEAANEETVE